MFRNTEEVLIMIKNYQIAVKTELVIFAISITRFEAKKAIEILNKDKFKISLCNILWIKPLKINKKFITLLKNSKYGGLVIDDDYEDGVAKSIANNCRYK